MQRVELNLTKKFAQIRLDKRKVALLAVARQGPAGRDGTTTIVKTCGVNISGHKVVTVNNAGNVIYADNTIPAHANKVIGVTINAALTNQQVTIVPNGEISDPSFSWLPDYPIFLGTNGALTQMVPATGFFLIVGFPTSSTSMVVRPQPAIT